MQQKLLQDSLHSPFLVVKGPFPKGRKNSEKMQRILPRLHGVMERETVRSRMILEIILPEVTPDEIQSQCAQQGATDFTLTFIIK